MSGTGYRIQEASRRLGLSPATLRAWERRYGVPRPSRSRGAYRLYDDGDLAQLVRMQELVASGMAPAQAATAVLSEGLPPANAAAAAGLVELGERIVAAAVEFDAATFDHALERALATTSVPLVCDDLIVPVLQRLGELWASGKLGVAHEHWASHKLGTTLANLARLVQPLRPTRRAVVACLPHEEHEYACHVVALHLAQAGVACLVLGGKTPAAALQEAVERISPDLVALTTSCPIPEPRPLVRAIARACGSTPWYVGGSGAKALGKLISASGGHVVDASPGAFAAAIA